MKIKFGSMSVSVNLFILPVFMVLFFMGELAYYLIVLACAFFHELGHIIMARLLGFKVRTLEFLPVGVTAWIEIRNGRCLWKEILLYISGPLINIIFAILSILLKNLSSEYANSLMYINIGLAVLNLMPILPLDGGKILNSFLSYYYSCLKANSICIITSECLIFVIAVLSLIAVFYTYNVTFMFVMIFIMVHIFKNRHILKSHALTELLDKKNIHERARITKTKIITAHGDLMLIDIIKEFSLGYYFLVVTLDKNMDISSIISETQILNHLFINGVNDLLTDIKN